MKELEYLQDEFWKRVSENRTQVIDLRDAEQRRVYYAEMGTTEEEAEIEYKELYEEVKRLTQLEPPLSDNIGRKDSFDGRTMSLGENGGVGCIHSSDYVDEHQEMLIMNLKLLNKSDPSIPMRVCNPYVIGYHYLEGRLDMIPFITPKGNTTYQTRALHNSYKDGKLGFPMASSVEQTIVNKGEVVKEVKVVMPRKINSPPSDPNIIICYNREATPTEAADKSYQNVVIKLEGKGQKVDIHMPFQGEITVSNEYIIKGIRAGTFELKINIAGKTGRAEFDRSLVGWKDMFVVDKDRQNVISWDFTLLEKIGGKNINFERWNSFLPIEDISNNVIVSLQCSITLLVSLKPKEGEVNAVSWPVDIVIRSDMEEPDHTNIKIPFITIWWGCLGKNTWISMADGSKKPIEEIKEEEMVLDTEGKARRVTAVFWGKEEQMCYVETFDGCSLLLTENHPVETDRGMIRAKDLTAADRLRTAQGFQTITTLMTKEYKDKVYSLKLEEPCTVFCSGIACGDFDVQQECLPYEREEKAFREPKEMTPLMKDLLRLTLRNSARNSCLGAGVNTSPAHPYYAYGFMKQHSTVCIPVEKREIIDTFTMDIWALSTGQSDRMLSQEGSFAFGITEGNLVMTCREETYMVSCMVDTGRWNQYIIRYGKNKLSLGVNGKICKTWDLKQKMTLTDKDIKIGGEFTGYVRRVTVYNDIVEEKQLALRMFRNVYTRDMKNLLAFIDSTSSQIKDRGPFMKKLTSQGWCGMELLASGYLPSEGGYAQLEHAPEINPGGFQKSNFGIYLKLYTQSFDEGKIVLLANGSFGDGDEVILYTEQSEENDRKLYLALGGEILDLGGPLPNEQWVDIVVGYDATSNTVSAAIDGEQSATVHCDAFHRNSPGELIIGNVRSALKEDCTSPDVFSTVAVFDIPLNVTHATAFLQSQPFLFHRGVRALYTFESGAWELISQREVLFKGEIQLLKGTVLKPGTFPYLYETEIDIGHSSDKGKRLYKEWKEKMQKTIGLDLTGYYQENQNAVCTYLEEAMKKKGDRGAFLYGLCGASYANAEENRRASPVIDKYGINCVLASLSAIGDMIGE